MIYQSFLKRAIILIACLMSLSFFACQQKIKTPDFAEIESGFRQVPDSIQTSVYWYWISDNLSKEGVEKDLEAMKRVGINRAFIGNIGLPENETAYGDVKIFSEDWWDILHAALKKASALNIEIGLFNSPGWSQSGGPWVKPEQSMRYLSHSETKVQGPQQIRQALSAPSGSFQDVRVMAFRAPQGHGASIADRHPEIISQPNHASALHAVDANPKTEWLLSDGDNKLTFRLDSNFTARSLAIYPARRNMKMDLLLEQEQDGRFQPVKSFSLDRSNNEINVGFEPYAPVIVSFNAVSAKAFRLTVRNASEGAGIAEVMLSPTPKVERVKEKSLAKMHPTPLPYWHDYQWPAQDIVTDANYLTKEDEVLDISSHMDDQGVLDWQVPDGEWIILRTGMLPTGAKNGPASPEGTGLEIDKINHRHLSHHFDAFLGEVMRRIPEEDRKTFNVAVQDSYEMGGQNWTDDFIQQFKSVYHYDPTPYIPVFFGYVIGSQDESDRFLWDLRRFVADRVAYEYVGGLRDISHQHGLTIWLENYGHWGFPGEFLQYGGQSDEIGGEFWSEGELGDIENRAASSSAHIYGKRKVSAESFTAAGNTFGRYPAMMKQRGDRFFTEGINNTLLHVYIHQPYEDRKPGVNAWFGNEFNRFNTWYEEMGDFIQYLKRCNFMLQQGTFVADVAYFIGEDAPKMTGVQDPPLPKGYDFDYINGEVIRERLQVKDGKWVLPDGLSYRILVLPKLETMRPELLQTIRDQVKKGGIVLGPRPNRSPSLEKYGQADEEVKALAKELWGDEAAQQKMNKVGQGMVLTDMDLEEAFALLDVQPDVKLDNDDPTLFIHRTLDDGDLYFISNQQNEPISIHPTFRIKGKQPEWWNAINGEIRELLTYSSTADGTTVPLELAPYESAFIVFRKDLQHSQGTGGNFPKLTEEQLLDDKWLVTFNEPFEESTREIAFDELQLWNEHPDDSIRYFSGKATYQQDFIVEKPIGQVGKPGGEEQLWLDIGSVYAIARIHINGKDVGSLWTPPYRINISDYVVEGKNTLHIEVVNTWKNRLIGDLRLPESSRKTWTIVNPYKREDELAPAGLQGPVKLLHMR